MATSNWVGGTGGSETSLATAANYSPSGVPGGTDTLLIGVNIASSYSIATGLTQHDGSTGQTWEVGPKMTGSIGTSGSPVQIGTGTVLNFRGPNVPFAHFDIQTCTKARILETFGIQQCLKLSAGTYTQLIVAQAAGLLLASGVTVTTARILQAMALIEAGVTITTWEQSGGMIDCASTPTNVLMNGGQFKHTNGTTATNTLLRIMGGVFIGEGASQTYSEVDMWGGVFNGENIPVSSTITAGRIRRGALCNLQNGSNSFVAALTKLGGVIRGGTGVVITEDVSPVGI